MFVMFRTGKVEERKGEAQIQMILTMQRLLRLPVVSSGRPGLATCKALGQGCRGPLVI
jgi:hypothetical protein